MADNEKPVKVTKQLPKFTDPADLRKKIQEYFDECEGKRLPTKTGLCLFLGVNRKYLADIKDLKFNVYPDAKKNQELKRQILDVVEWAHLFIESKMEDELYRGGKNTIGLIFGLKNNYQWKDKEEAKGLGNSDNPITIKIVDDISGH